MSEQIKDYIFSQQPSNEITDNYFREPIPATLTDADWNWNDISFSLSEKLEEYSDNTMDEKYIESNASTLITRV